MRKEAGRRRGGERPEEIAADLGRTTKTEIRTFADLSQELVPLGYSISQNYRVIDAIRASPVPHEIDPRFGLGLNHVSGQRSAVSGQRSAVSGQRSAVSI